MKEYGTVQDLLSDILPFKVKDILNLKSEGTIASTRENVTVVTEDGEEVLLFMKVRRKGSVTEEFDKVYGMFNREGVMYGEVLPLLDCFLKENVSDDNLKVLEMFPKYYGGGLVNDDLYLIFEDILTESDRYVTGKSDFHSKEQILLTLQHLGSFHAMSYCLQIKTGVNVLKKFPILDEPVYHPDRVEMFKAYVQGQFTKHLKILQVVSKAFEAKNNLVCSNLDQVCSVQDISRLLEFGDNLFGGLLFNLLKPDQSTSVITHGDFHMWNIAFLGHPSPSEAMFFDLQVSRWSSGVTDIVQYLYQVAATPDRTGQNLDQFVGQYCKGFRSIVKLLGLPTDGVDVCSETWVMAECERLVLWGVMFGVSFILPRFVQNEDMFNKIDDRMLDSDDSDENVIDTLDKSGDDIWFAVKTVMDIIDESRDCFRKCQ